MLARSLELSTGPDNPDPVSGSLRPGKVCPPPGRPTCPAPTSPSPSTRTDMVRLACTKCERRGQYRKATLIARYGPDKNMVDLRLELAAGCPKIEANKVMDLCGVYYPDRIGR